MAAIIEFGFNAPAVSAGITKLEQRLRGFDKIVASSGKGLGLIGAANAGSLVRFTGGLVQAAGRMEAYRSALQAVSKDTAPLAAQIERLRELARAPGLNFEQAVQGSVRLQATGMRAAEAEDTLKQLANALRSVGGSAQQLDGVTLALSQIMAKGKVSAEEINQIAERMPQIRALMQQAFGTADTERLQKMGLSSQAFISGITAEAAKLPRVMNGTNSAIEQLLDQWEQLKAVVGEPIASGLVPLMQALTRDMPGWSSDVRQLVKTIIDYGDAMGDVITVALRLYAATKLLSWGKVILDLQAKRAATVAAAAAITQETAAVTANTAAQRANASATAAANAAHAVPRGPGKAALYEGRPKLSGKYNEQEVMDRLAASGAAYAAGRQAGQKILEGVKTSIHVGGSVGAAALGAWSNSLIPAMADLGTQAAKAMTDAISLSLVMSGGPMGAALAMAAQGAWVIMAKRMQSLSEAASAFDANTSAIGRADAQAKLLDEVKARQIIEQRIKTLKEQAAAATGIEAAAYQANARELELELRRLPQKIELYRAAAAEALRLGDIEARNAQREKLALAQQAAMGRVLEIRRAVMDHQIEQAPLQQQTQYWADAIREGLGAALAEVNLDRLATGQGILRGWKLEIDSITRAMAALSKQGDFLNAERLGKALREAQAAADKLASARKRESEIYDHLPTAQDAAREVREKAEKERAQGLAKEELALEQAILQARLAAGDRENDMVNALEDRLAALRQMQQIEASGVARGAQALEMARQRVAAERALSEQVARQQQQKARTDISQELAVLEAKAKGNDKLAQAMERHQAIQERAAQIQEQTGMDSQRALAAARRIQELQDAVTAREAREAEATGPDGQRRRRKIGAPTAAAGIDHDRHGLSGRVSGRLYQSVPLAMHSPLTRNGGLAGYHALQRGEFGNLSGILGASATGMRDAITAAQARSNAASKGLTTTGVEAGLEKIFQALTRVFWGS